MDNTVIKSLNTAGSVINFKLEHEKAFYYIIGIYLISYASASFVINLSQFSVDSWTYFELSKTIFTENFYKFNTFRSYFSNEYSASFPAGWPTVLAMASALIGQNPLNAVYINIFIVSFGVLIFQRIGKTLNLNALSIFLIYSSLLLYRPYVDEVLSGKSMPMAVISFLIAFYLYQKNSLFMAGLFLGIASLVRFDFLVYALIFQLCALAIGKLWGKKYFLLVGGFLIGILPWVFFSYIKFEKVWASDNSWVGFSALPAYVLDYPASPVVAALNDPTLWLSRIFGNLIPLIKSISKSTIYFPILLVLILFLGVNLNRLSNEAKYKLIAIFAAHVFALAPYMLTGYFDSRYFTLIFIIDSALIMYILNSNLGLNYFGFNLNGVNLLLAIGTLSFGLIFFVRDVSFGYDKLIDLRKQKSEIINLYSCHIMNPRVVYVFTKEDVILASRYGAVTGARSALIPTNFDTMTSTQKNSYLKFMQPYSIIDNNLKFKKCTNQ